VSGTCYTITEPRVTYYEELGLESSAAPEEIRRAYRKLAQILHPDQHQDEVLRRICERQLARLNGIAEILGDPERRREYDLRLQAECRSAVRGRGGIPRAVAFVKGLSAATWVWLAAAVAGLMLMTVLFRWSAVSAGESPDRPGREQTKSEGRGTGVTAEARATPKHAGIAGARVKAKRAFMARVRDPSLAAPVPAQASASPSNPTTAPASHAAEPEPREIARVLPEPPSEPAIAVSGREEAPRSEPSYFAGRWFFSHDVSQQDAALYSPEMIELAITDQNGILRGRYRGRYRVTDRPISPDVDFEFSGPAGTEETREFTWVGTGGALGQVRLKAITRVSMEVKWWATRAGGLDLTSGTAVLIRSEER
jgi:hypothetical protein